MSDYAQHETVVVPAGLPPGAESIAPACQHDSGAACAACLVSAARELLAVSDALDRAEARARAAWSAGYRAGADATEARARSEGYIEAVACIKRIERELVALVRGIAKTCKIRWHLCCPACRRAGHRAGCHDCQDRTREMFGGPMPGEYTGGPVTWAPESMRGAA